MIKTVRLHNFKAFEDTGQIELRPLTVLAGPNSGGKSSLLQGFLLLKQTLEAEVPDVDLNLSGRFLQFSAFNELAFGKPPLRRSQIGYTFGLEGTIPTRVIPRYYPGLVIPEGAQELPFQTDVQFTFRYRKAEGGKEAIIIHSFSVNSFLQDRAGPRLAIKLWGKKYVVSMQGVDFPEPYQNREIRDVLWRHFLPGYFRLEPEPEEEPESSPIIGLDAIFRIPVMDLEQELTSNLKYLGPLREEPHRAYLQSGSPHPEIGKRGEFAPEILWIEKDDRVEYLPGLGEEVRESTLIGAVSDVFQRLGIVQPIDIRAVEAIVYQVLFGLKGRKKVTIADVGFGVSQLLPVVAMGLRCSKGSTMLLEHPEIHLHPRLQANLADFLLTLALSERRLLVETHSDHFINRLRRRIAQDPTDELREKISILFVRPPHDGQGAVIEPLQVDRYGVIENWPPEFLPESADEAEAIFRAGLEKRRVK